MFYFQGEDGRPGMPGLPGMNRIFLCTRHIHLILSFLGENGVKGKKYGK